MIGRLVVLAGILGAWGTLGAADVVWQDVHDPERLFLIDDSRLVHAEGDRVVWVARIAARDGDRMTLCSWGRATPLRIDRESFPGSVVLFFGDSDAGYDVRPSDGPLPPALRLEPLELPGPAVLETERLEALRAELRARAAEDQRVRTEDVDPEEWRRVDLDNREWIRRVLLEVGWIDRRRFGSEAGDHAFLLVQHSGDVRLMAAVVPRLQSEDGQSYALMFDRLQVGLARPQRYGTQIGVTEEGRQGLLEIEDLGNVDARRAAVGLPPLAEYLRSFGLDEAAVLSCP